jgi:hypothetical protein
LYELGASGHVAANTAERCGTAGCIRAVRYGNVEIVGNRVTANVARLTNWGIFASAEPGQGTVVIRDNQMLGQGEVPNRTDPSTAAYAWRVAGIEVTIGSATVTGNTVVNANTGILSRAFNAPLTISGSDNVIDFVHTGLIAQPGTTLALERSNLTGYVVPMGGPGTFRLPCNWWGDENGPVNVPDYIPASAYTPFATQPVAGRANVGCD